MSLLFLFKASRYYATASGRFYALKKTTLAFPNRGLVAIKGKSGSGKSTMLNLLSGMDRPSEGRVYFEGREALSSHMGDETAMIFQHYNLIPHLSVMANVLLPLKINGGDKKRALAILKTLGLYQYRNKDAAKLSGGEKQRVAIARALVSKPKVIFADEPTGALDERNSETVMNALKEISKKRLVVMVSHNDALIERYADRIIEMKDGSVISDSSEMRPTKSKAIPKKKKHSITWIPRFVVRNVRKHLLKDAMCFVSGTIGFSALLLSLGFFLGNGPAIEKEQGRTLHYLSASLSKETSTDVPGSNLKLIKKTRPSLDEALDYIGENSSGRIVNDYSYFLPESMVYSIEEETYPPAQFSPVWDLTLEEFGMQLLHEGEPAPDNSLHYAIANTEFFDSNGWDLLGKSIQISSRFVVTYEGIKNERYLDASLTLVGAVKEFGFLNSPRIYYSYQGLEEELSEIEVDGEKGSLPIDKLVDGAQEDSALASYSRLLFLESEEEVRSLFVKMDNEEGDIKAGSIAYGLRNSFLALSEAFVSSLALFVGIAFAGVALILAMAGFSSLIEGRKENAILLTQGARQGDVLLLYACESMFLCGNSVGLSLIISPFLQQIANFLLKREFDAGGIIDIPYRSFLGVPGLAIWGLLLLGSLFGFLVVLIPVAFAKKRNLAEELRDE